MYRTRSFDTTDTVQFYFGKILWISFTVLPRNENEQFTKH